MNEKLQDGFLQRIRYAMKPDEAYGLIFSWDNVVVSNFNSKLVGFIYLFSFSSYFSFRGRMNHARLLFLLLYVFMFNFCQVNGEIEAVHEALLQITTRLKHHFFRDSYPSVNYPSNSPFLDQLPPFPPYLGRRGLSPPGMYSDLGPPPSHAGFPLDVAPCGACRPWIFFINGVLCFLKMDDNKMEKEET